jgi:hypothetical protein
LYASGIRNAFARGSMTSAPAAPLARYAAFKRMGDFVFL